MFQEIRERRSLLNRASDIADALVGLFSPQRAYQRKAWRMSYDILDGHRTRKKRSGLGGTGNRHADERTLVELREIARDMSRNNAIIDGMLTTEANGVIGTGTAIQARTSDTGWNRAAETLWKEEMVMKPCDITNQYNWNQLLYKAYRSYRRDGDVFLIYGDNWIQAVEGDQVGTPAGTSGIRFTIINGVAVENSTGRVIGYYVGKPDTWGNIHKTDYKKFYAEDVHPLINTKRFSQSRGEPAITPAMAMVDRVMDYLDAELVAAKVNACFAMFVARKEGYPAPDAYTGGVNSSGYDSDSGSRLEKLDSGIIIYGRDGESATGIGQARPNSAFDSFVTRLLGLLGKPLEMPLMLITLDYSGATFMNARIAYQQVQSLWKVEQDLVVKPFCSRTWGWFIRRMVAQKRLTPRDDMMSHDVLANRWPYVDPEKEAKADGIELENGTINRKVICARKGNDFEDIEEQRKKEEAIIGKREPKPDKPAEPAAA